MKSFLYILLFLSLFPSLSSGAVIVDMLVDGAPVDLVMVPQDTGFSIDFSITFDDPFPEFYGIVALDGVGVLNEPTYPGDIIILPDDPPILGENTWPLFYTLDPMAVPIEGVFASSDYQATTVGSATVNLYQTDATFTTLDLIDSFDIDVIPEPCTMLFLGIGTLCIRLRKP